MNPTTPTPAITIQTIERYLADSPGSEPLNTLGMTADGRIVRLNELDEHRRPELQQALEQQLWALTLPGENKALSEWMIKKQLCAEFPTLDNFRDRIRQHQQIRQRLSELKTQYATECKKLDQLTTTHVFLEEVYTSGTSQPGQPFWEYLFTNEFTQRYWAFKNNRKTGAVNARDFYMSNVITRQFEQTFDAFGWLLELPKVIERCTITNKKTLEVLVQHQADYHSEVFRTAFLETTVNGKSTVAVAQDLGLIIGRLIVTYNGCPVNRVDEPMIPDQVKCKFSVRVHVSPDPAVYPA